MSAGFTPGPWRTGKQRKVYAENAELPVAQAVAAQRDYAEATANARLIAAAPELYEALEYMRANLGNPVPIGRRHVARKADAALAKARGEA